MDFLSFDSSVWELLPHNGYGSFFNKIYTSRDRMRLIKHAVCTEGKRKLQKELNFYKYIMKNIPQFPIPCVFWGECKEERNCM